MEMEVANPTGVKRRYEEIFSLLEECRNSNMSMKEFVKLKGTHKTTYYNWRNKYCIKDVKQKQKTGFSTLEIKPSLFMDADRLFVQVWGNKIYQPVTSVYRRFRRIVL
ncbi:MAG TPA: hypothetical protein VGG71_00985 [Chitinophagaceae bacterium]